MHIPNYMLQDFIGVLVAIILFVSITIFPGYVTGFAFDLFNFRNRQSFVQFGIALLVSISISPILFFLSYRVISGRFTLFLLMLFAITFALTVFHTRGLQRLAGEIKGNRNAKIGVIIASLWIFISTWLLIDLQWGDRLYYNIVAYDYSTRVSVIDAITRTGVPPQNPSYFMGTPQPLTQVYYFWYVLCSIIDQIGVGLVDARAALIASVTWTGLALFAFIALYIRMRNPSAENKIIWRNTWIGSGLLLVSGLDIIPGSFYIFFPRLLVRRIIEGDIEQWNEQVTAWLGAVTWTPHHVISMLSCLFAWLLIASSRDDKLHRQIAATLIAGFAIASAFGLSVWITFIFAVFWVIWGIMKLLQRESILKLWTMILPGLVAVISILPFLIDLFFGPGASSTMSQFPLAFNIRAFYPLEIVTIYSPTWEKLLLYLLALPLNYFLEFGFFFLAGILWFQYCRKNQQKTNPFALSEVSLFLTTAFMATFIRSTIIVNNDFGWRGWMFGQFILIFWGVDLIRLFWGGNHPPYVMLFQKPREIKTVRLFLTVLLTIGVMTSFYDMFILRFWPIIIDTGIAGFPRILTPDNHLGERTLATREAYEFIDSNTPATTIVQFDPRYTMDRPSGLYRTRSTAISYHSLYGVPENTYKPLIESVGNIFDEEDDWQVVDSKCDQFHINILILRDLDPIWSNLAELKSKRAPLYENKYTALFDCGLNSP